MLATLPHTRMVAFDIARTPASIARKISDRISPYSTAVAARRDSSRRVTKRSMVLTPVLQTAESPAAGIAAPELKKCDPK